MDELGSLPKALTMTLRSQIEAAFGDRQRPSQLIEKRTPITPEQHDALWFEGRHWRAIGWQDWQSHPDAFYAFVPTAFIFYLPSILIGAIEAPHGHLLVADSLLGMLDRSPDLSQWDDFLIARLVGLQEDEYDALRAWILSRSGLNGSHDEDSLARAYETIDLLARETIKLRNLLRKPLAGSEETD